MLEPHAHIKYFQKQFYERDFLKNKEFESLYTLVIEDVYFFSVFIKSHKVLLRVKFFELKYYKKYFQNLFP